MYKRLEFSKYQQFVNYVEEYDSNSSSSYVFTTIQKKLTDNERIMPRVRTTYQESNKPVSLQDYMNQEEVLFAINAGIFNTKTERPECVLISNGKIIVDQGETYVHVHPDDGGDKRDELYILGISRNGELIIYPPKTSCKKILEDGCVDAIMGFVPLIINYRQIDEDQVCSYISYGRHPRQIIGEDKDGNYFVLTVKKPGMTLKEARELLYHFGVRVAYNLDGGSSTQTVFHKEKLIPAYREKNGRKIPTVITFEVITGKLVI